MPNYAYDYNFDDLFGREDQGYDDQWDYDYGSDDSWGDNSRGDDSWTFDDLFGETEDSDDSWTFDDLFGDREPERPTYAPPPQRRGDSWMSEDDFNYWEPEEEVAPVKREGEVLSDAMDTVTSGFKGLGAGSAMLGESAGAAVQWLGNRLPESIGEPISDVGKKVADYYEEQREAYSPPNRIQGSVWDNPKLMADPEWLTYNVANFAPSMTAAILPGALLSKGLRIGGEVIKLTPKVIERISKLGLHLGAGTAGGSMEGLGTYRELLRNGKSEEEASNAGAMMGLFSAGLNTLGFSQILSGAKGNALQKVAKRVLAGGTEAATEWAEEPAEVIAKDIASYLETGEAPEGTWGRIVESIKSGANVALPAFIMGGGASLASGSGAVSPEDEILWKGTPEEEALLTGPLAPTETPDKPEPPATQQWADRFLDAYDTQEEALRDFNDDETQRRLVEEHGLDDATIKGIGTIITPLNEGDKKQDEKLNEIYKDLEEKEKRDIEKEEDARLAEEQIKLEKRAERIEGYVDDILDPETETTYDSLFKSEYLMPEEQAYIQKQTEVAEAQALPEQKVPEEETGPDYLADEYREDITDMKVEMEVYGEEKKKPMDARKTLKDMTERQKMFDQIKTCLAG